MSEHNSSKPGPRKPAKKPTGKDPQVAPKKEQRSPGGAAKAEATGGGGGGASGAAKARPPKADTKSKGYRDNELVLIKPYKGRQKFELYIHHAPLREFVQASGLNLPVEGFDGYNSIRKKLIFREASYGTMLQAILAWLERARRKKNSDLPSLQATINELTEAIIVEFKLDDPAKQQEADFDQRLQKAYDRAASLFADLLNQ